MTDQQPPAPTRWRVTKMTTDLQQLLDQIQERSRTAGEHVARLCTKEDRWKMSVPVQDDDSDILLTQITDRDIPQLAKALQAVMEIHKPFHADHYYNGMDGESLHRFVPRCEGCDDAGGIEDYPCPTVQTIHDALEANDD